FFLTSTFRSLAFGQFKHRIRPEIIGQIMLIGVVIAAVLCGIGSVLIGGPLGWLGVVLCLRLGLWPLRALYRWSVSGGGVAGFSCERESQWLIALYVVFPLLFVVLSLVVFALWRR